MKRPVIMPLYLRTNTTNNTAGDPTMDGASGPLSRGCLRQAAPRKPMLPGVPRPRNGQVFHAGEEIEVDSQLFTGTLRRAPLGTGCARLSLLQSRQRTPRLCALAKKRGRETLSFSTRGRRERARWTTDGLQTGNLYHNVFSDEFRRKRGRIINTCRFQRFGPLGEIGLKSIAP